MISFRVDKAERILFVVMTGKVSEAEIDAACDQLEEEVPSIGVHIRGGTAGGGSLFIDWERLEGWEMGAKSLGTMTTKMMMGDAVGKVAVIADARWSDEKERLSDILPHAEIRFFTPDHRAAGLAWLGID